MNFEMQFKNDDKNEVSATLSDAMMFFYDTLPFSAPNQTFDIADYL